MAPPSADRHEGAPPPGGGVATATTGAEVPGDSPPGDQPVLPDYAGPNICGLVPQLLRPAGDRARWLPAPAVDARQVVLLVVDGLGWTQLDERRFAAPQLAAMDGGAITSVVPTTTATALSSIALGATPAEHGVVGYRVRVDGPSGEEVLNVLRWRTPSGDARPFVAPERFQVLAPFGGRPVPVVSKSEFAGTGFSEAHLRGAPLCGWSVASSVAVEVRRLLRRGEPLVYAYYDGLDRAAHVTGLGEHYEAELRFVDRLVADLAAELASDAALVVTADHGQVDVGTLAERIDPGVLEETRLVSGEGRFRWLHARPGLGADALAAATRARYGGEAWVLTEAEVEAAGWFGGPLSDEVRRRLGDVALVARGRRAYLDPADQGDSVLVSRHGSLTADEMLVPLLAVGG